jgi:acyl-CoA synthetase (AMP-forming)/AMP-acid ligase II
MIQDSLEAVAERTPERVAVIAGSRQLTYGEVDDQANRVAHGLIAAGVQPGDRVAICLDNRLETVVAIFAVLKAGAAFMMVNPTTKAQKLLHLLGHARARALVLASPALHSLGESLGALQSLDAIVAVGPGAPAAADGQTLLSWEELLTIPSPGRPSRRGIDLDLAALLYTSGSTGDAKGVMLTHLNVQSAVRSIVEYLRLASSDVILDVLPLSFGYGLTQLFPVFHVGGRLVLEKGMVFPHVTLTQMTAHRVTGFAMVPTIATVLLGMDLGQYDLSSLRYVTNAGAGLPPELARRFRAALPHVDLVLMYGQTECLRVLYLDPADVDARPDAVGRGMPNQELWLVAEDGSIAGPNTVGELVVRGAHVMAGYWDLPQETERKLRPGRLPGERVLYTGDLFRRDEAGYYYFVARQDDIIKSRGEKVSPREVENALYALEGVLDAAVVGVPHPLLGQAVKAVIVVKAGCSLEARDVQRHCAANLEDFMVPSIVEFRDELPKNERGKVLKRELTAPASV